MTDTYFRDRWEALVNGQGTVDCQSCHGCCRANYTIGLSEAEAEVLPHTRVEGFPVILPEADGKCPFLVDEVCTVYEKRPISCRQYDCRDLARSGILLVERGPGEVEINQSIKRFLTSDGMDRAMAEVARGYLKAGMNACDAASGALVCVMVRALPRGQRAQLEQHLTSKAETQRKKANDAADRARGQPA